MFYPGVPLERTLFFLLQRQATIFYVAESLVDGTVTCSLLAPLSRRSLAREE